MRSELWCRILSIFFPCLHRLGWSYSCCRWRCWWLVIFSDFTFYHHQGYSGSAELCAAAIVININLKISPALTTQTLTPSPTCFVSDETFINKIIIIWRGKTWMTHCRVENSLCCEYFHQLLRTAATKWAQFDTIIRQSQTQCWPKRFELFVAKLVGSLDVQVISK